MKKNYLYYFASTIVLGLITLLGFYSYQRAAHLKTHYSPSQFQPKNHQILSEDQKIRELYQLESTSPHILLLQLPHNKSWLTNKNFLAIKTLTESIKQIESVESVLSIANVETAIVDQESFYIGKLSEVSQDQKHRQRILANPLLAPQLIDSSGKSTAIVITPKEMATESHLKLINQVKVLASVYTPEAQVQVGGPAAIRTQITSLLSQEILHFVLFSLAGATLILLLVFKSWVAIPIILTTVFTANIISLGIMALLGASFTVLSTTVPILVTITVVAISTHSLVRLSDDDDESSDRIQFILKTMKGLAGPHMLTALTTMIGFGTLILSQVPLIREYGLTITCVIPAAALLTLIMLPTLLLWAPLPTTRTWLKAKDTFAHWVVHYKTPLFFLVTSGFVILMFYGHKLQWTSRMFDDLPTHHEARRSTEYINRHLGGVIPLEISVGFSEGHSNWKDLKKIQNLDALIKRWRSYRGVGSVVGLPDFLKVANSQQKLPKNSTALAEVYFVYGMSSDNPLRNFITPNENYTRIWLKFKDIPSNQMQATIEKIKKDLEKTFPKSEVFSGGLAATIHPLNEILSKDLIFGFFHAMIGILILLTIVFKSLKWSLVSVIPNLVPPVVLLGALAISQTPIKPSIAIIFAISLGIAFDNTVYILGRLKEMLKLKIYKQIPVQELLCHEVSPCLVTSFSLFAGFSIFLLSYFTMNKIFGIFMLLSIVAGLVGDLILLPSTLKLFPRLLINPDRFSASVDGHQPKGGAIFRTTLSLLIISSLSLFFFPSQVGAKVNSADHILKKVESISSAPNEVAEITMKITESDGSKKTREIRIKRKNTGSQKALVKIIEPSDLKGVALLSVHSGSDEDQWLYLPSAKRSRRILGSNKKGKFLDSDLSYEDMRISTYNQFKNTIKKTLKKGKQKVVLIESLAKSDQDSSYSKILTWVSLPSHRVEKAEYYGPDGKILKVMSFKKYKKFGKQLWRARTVHVKNVRENRATTLELKKLSLKSLKDDEFSMAALEE